MSRVFIALENTASAFGLKGGNSKNVPAKEKKPGWKVAEQKKAQAYEDRKALADRLGFDYKKDDTEGRQEKNIRFIVQQLANQRGHSYGIAGSLPSLFKRLSFDANRKGQSFDTVVFLGHGHSGVMTVGLGRFPLAEQDEKLLNAQKRMINVSDPNKALWTETFHENREALNLGGVLHILFLGCKTAEQSSLSYKTLPKVVASALSQKLQCDVICYGTDQEIVNEEIVVAIGNIKKITDAASGGGLHGSIGLAEYDDELESITNLDWHRVNHV